MCGSCAPKCFNATEVEHIKLHGISEGEEHIDDLRQTPESAKQMGQSVLGKRVLCGDHW